ncbi:MAG: hypothetical protein HDS93_00810 [Bacteroidales bacterium]|nr:hypothetical protein [Bacteroidales bacterium]
MTADKVISVNPSQATLGSLHPEITARYLRQHCTVPNHTSLGKRIFRFATAATASKSLSTKMVLIRILSAAMLLILSQSTLLSSTDLPSSLLIVSGLFFATGFMTVPTAAVMTVLSVFAIITGCAHGITPLISMLSLMISAIIMLMGPGKISADYILTRLMRHRIIRSKRNRINAPISYKAFRNANF